MIIALTGSNGSIGKELAPFLQGLGHSVITISSSKAGDGVKNFSYDDMKTCKINVKVDLFIHLASINNKINKLSIGDELKITKTVLSSLDSLKCKKLIFFSTSKVYGDNNLKQNFFDESSALDPKCFYGKAKKLCEELIITQASFLNISVLILRLPPVLNNSKSSNISKLINLSKKSIVIPSLIYGESNQRSFISFNNIKYFFNHILENPHLLEKREIYNLSDSGFISLHELLSIVGKSKIFSLPKLISKLFISIPVVSTILIKLYGNFVIDNQKLKKDMDVKLETTAESLNIIYK